MRQTPLPATPPPTKQRNLSSKPLFFRSERRIGCAARSGPYRQAIASPKDAPRRCRCTRCVFGVIYLLVIVLTTIWVGVDASNHNFRGGGFFCKTTAGWSIGCLL